MEITATDWLEMEFIKLEKTIGVNHKMYELLEQAKIIDKQNLINAYIEASENPALILDDAEQYYNETFKQK